MKCSVLNCPYTSQADGKKISFFSLPKSDKIAKKWLRFCGNPKLEHHKNPFVCSDHFKSDDIIGGKEFVCRGFRRRLRPCAVPCIKKAPETEAINEPTNKKKTRENSSIIPNVIFSNASTKEDTSEPGPENNAEDIVDATPPKLSEKPKSSKIDDYIDTESSEAVIDELSNQIKDLQQENLRIKVNCQLLLKKRQSEIRDLKRKLDQANSKIVILRLQLKETE